MQEFAHQPIFWEYESPGQRQVVLHAREAAWDKSVFLRNNPDVTDAPALHVGSSSVPGAPRVQQFVCGARVLVTTPAWQPPGTGKHWQELQSSKKMQLPWLLWIPNSQSNRAADVLFGKDTSDGELSAALSFLQQLLEPGEVNQDFSAETNTRERQNCCF